MPTIETFFGTVQKTDSHTLELDDAWQTVEISKASAVNLTVPPNSSVAFPVGTRIFLKRTGAGAMTIVQGSGVTVTGSSGGLTDPGLNVEMALRKTGTDTWDLQNGAPALTWSSWTPAVTGFSVNPSTLTGSVCENGEHITVRITAATGTSNATTFTITNLPYAAEEVSHHVCIVVNNGTQQAGMCTTGVGSSVLTIYANPASGAFTASGIKSAFITITYRRQ